MVAWLEVSSFKLWDGLLESDLGLNINKQENMVDCLEDNQAPLPPVVHYSTEQPSTCINSDPQAGLK